MGEVKHTVWAEAHKRLDQKGVDDENLTTNTHDAG